MKVVRFYEEGGPEVLKLEDLPEPDFVVVPVAGAGLLSGTVATIAALRRTACC